jgi:hypothetical protein
VIAAQPEPPTAGAQPPSAENLEAWRKSMVATPRPPTGCFTASYPDTQWQEVPCTTAPDRPYPPKSGPPSETVGNGTDYSAEVTGSISEAEGSFVSVTGVTSESGAGIANAYSLQLNTQFFTTTTCSGAANPSACRGWEQFVFSNSPPSAGAAFIQYWLLDYATKCPSGWNKFQSSCYINSTQAASVPAQKIHTLGELTVTGTAAAGSAEDSIVLAVGSTLYTAKGNNYFPDLGQNWQAAEFNVFGDGGGSEAVFNSGSTIVVMTSVNNGTTSAPSAVEEGFTGETNNLTLTGTPVVSGGTSPSIEFTESNAGFTLSVSTVGHGKVKSSPAGIECGATCSASFAAGTKVKLTATPASGWKFHEWSGACTGKNEDDCHVTMNAAESVMAKFKEK